MSAPIITAPISPVIPQTAPGVAQHGFDDVLIQGIGPDANAGSVSQLRNYDLAVREWIQGVTHFHGQTLPVLKEAPMIAFSSYRQLLETQKVTPIIMPGDARSEVDKLPLPFVTFQRGNIDIRTNEQNQNWPIRNLQFLSGTNQRRTAYSRYPKPLIIEYQIDIWCRYENHANFFQFKILEQFDGRVAYWSVANPITGVKMMMPIRDRNIRTTSDTEIDKDRIIRITMTVHVEAWIFFDVIAAPTYEITTRSYDVGGDETDQSLSTRETPLAPELTVQQISALPTDPKTTL